MGTSGGRGSKISTLYGSFPQDCNVEPFLIRGEIDKNKGGVGEGDLGCGGVGISGS